MHVALDVHTSLSFQVLATDCIHTLPSIARGAPWSLARLGSLWREMEKWRLRAYQLGEGSLDPIYNISSWYSTPTTHPLPQIYIYIYIYIVRCFACQKWEILIYFFHFFSSIFSLVFNFFSLVSNCFFFSSISIPHQKKKRREDRKKMIKPKKTDDETEDSKETEVQTDKATGKKTAKVILWEPPSLWL